MPDAETGEAMTTVDKDLAAVRGIGRCSLDEAALVLERMDAALASRSALVRAINAWTHGIREAAAFVDVRDALRQVRGEG